MKAFEGISWGVSRNNGGTYPLDVAKRQTGVSSGSFDTAGNHEARVVLARFTSSSAAVNGPKLVLGIRHGTSSTTTFASATAFSPVLSSQIVSGLTRKQIPHEISLAGVGRFLICRLSSITQSGVAGVICELGRNTANPATNRGNVAASGFTTASVYSPASP